MPAMNGSTVTWSCTADSFAFSGISTSKDLQHCMGVCDGAFFDDSVRWQQKCADFSA